MAFSKKNLLVIVKKIIYPSKKVVPVFPNRKQLVDIAGHAKIGYELLNKGIE